MNYPKKNKRKKNEKGDNERTFAKVGS